MHSLPKSLFVFLFCIPLAIVFGVLLATPLDTSTVLVVFGAMLILLTPILLTHHHLFLIASWNAYVNIYFLPGQPYIWMIATVMTCFFGVLTRTLNRGKVPILNVPSITWPLVCMALMSYVTSQLTGGIGAQAVGSNVFGGKRYLILWCAIVGYFAISHIPVPENKRQLYASLFVFSSVTAAVSNLALALGEKFYFLFLLFPVDWAMAQAVSEVQVGGFSRVAGLGPASLAVISYLLLRYGIKGTFDPRKAWRMVLFFVCVGGGLLSGFRSTLVLTVGLFAFQFFLEGLHKTKYLVTIGLGVVLLAATVLPFADRLPLSAQRCLSLLPLDLDAAAIEAARGSTDWRMEMWRAVVPDIPHYLWKGKGFAIDPKDLYFAQQNISLRTVAPYETALVAGDYHNGPLSLIIPFGIWGVLTFLWFSFAGLRLLWRNYQYGDESIKNINTFLLASFLTKLMFFIFIFGAFYMDLSTLVGIVAMSVALNRGMASPVKAPALVPVSSSPEPEIAEGAFQPAFARRITSW